MDPLERHLRDVLTSDRRVLPASLVPLERVHAGATRRRRRRAAAVATAGVLVLGSAGVAVALGGLQRSAPVGPVNSAAPTTGEASPSNAASTAATGPTGPAWSAARVASVTATSTRTLVVLGELGDTGACAPPDCVRLAESHDGGRSFTPLPVPADARGDGADGPTAHSATGVRFGSADDGWLFGGGLWSTHDGGRTWERVEVAGQVARLEAAAGRAWALVSAGSTAQLWTTPVGQDDWTRVPDVTVTRPADLGVQGDRVIVLGAETSRLWVGGTAGFTEHASPCPGALGVELSSVGSVWATCATGTAAGLSVSSDGVDWSSVPVSPRNGALPNSIAVGARTAREAVVGLGPDEPLARLSDKGTLTPVRRPPTTGDATSYVGFTTSEVGYAIVGTDLWRTDDGGDTWRRLRIG